MGLDASSSTIGYSIIDCNDNKIELITCNYIKPPKKGNIFDRLIKTQKLIEIILKEYKPDIVAIEDIAKFMEGLSTSNTIIILAVFNRSVGLACMNFLKHPPALYNVMRIRHGLKFSKQLPKKQEIPELVATHLNIKFPFIEKDGAQIEENFDMADSIAVALYARKRILELEDLLKKDCVRTGSTPQLIKKRTTAAKKQRKLDLEEYKELTGKEYGS